MSYRIAAGAEHEEVIARVHGFHARHCPVFRSLEAAIRITTSYERVPAGAAEETDR